MPGRLPFNKTISLNSVSAYWYYAWFEADRDYFIEEASVAPDSTAVSAMTVLYAGIFISQGGTTFGNKSFGTGSSGLANLPSIGAKGDALVQDITDPSGTGYNLMALLALLGNSNDWRIYGKQPILMKGQYLLLLVYSATPANSGGTVTFQVSGFPVN